jgi:hypothetical protein
LCLPKISSTPVNDRDEDAETQPLRHQVTVLERQMSTTRPPGAIPDPGIATASSRAGSTPYSRTPE